MHKWSGHGHDLEGAAATSLGELAIGYPACPHPGCNLPLNWDAGGPQAYLLLIIITDLVYRYILNVLQLMAISSYD